MTTDFTLAKNMQFPTHEVMAYTDISNRKINEIAIETVKNLVPKRGTNFKQQQEEKLSYKLIGLVLLLHLSVFVWMHKNKSEVEVIRQQKTILVSLLANAQPVTKAELKQQEMQQPVMKQPVMKQQAAEPKQHIPLNDLALKEAVMGASQVKSVDTQANMKEAVASTTGSSVAEKSASADLPPTDEAEQVTEAPKFGAEYLQNPAPEYPPLARRKGEQGRVLLQVLVSETGKAEKVKIETGSGYSSLDQAALEAVRKWSFIPAKKGSRPVSAYVIVPVRFSLNG